jgi:eukaryotic-like serine/threonine-protein kinase
MKSPEVLGAAADVAAAPLHGDSLSDAGVPCCRVAGGRATGTQIRVEIARLLLGRLRLVSLIVLVPSVLFLLRTLVDPQAPARADRSGVLLHAGVTMLTAVVAFLLWSGPAYPLRTLRGIELTLFGALVFFFAWLQWGLFRNPAWLSPGLADEEADVVRLAVLGSSVRWFFLIVLYGVFIPNTWQRCAAVVGLMACTPLVLTPLAALAFGRWHPELGFALADLAVLILTGVAVAVFGSYRIQVLQRQAFEARQLGQYRLRQRLGAGGMGEVYLAEHVLLRRPCAIKLIRPEQAGDAGTLGRFEREVRAMATLTHPNAVEVYDYGHADDGTFYYVMEYLPGPNLEALVARHGPLPAGRAIHLLRQVCGALREAHGIGLLHRDIKPSNVMVCERGRIYDVAKLLDFGLVHPAGLPKEAGRITVQGAILGSPPYMSPEQAAGREDVDARSDVYGLGGVVYFMLTGQPPFARETAMQMLLAHAYEPVVPPAALRPDVPADLQAVVLRCLAKRPEDRYASVDELEKALGACQDAGTWTQEKAAAWWESRTAQEETSTQHAAATAVWAPWGGG